MPREISISIGIVIERRKIDHPWAEFSWKPIAILPGAGPVDEWKEIVSGDGWTQFHAATLPLTLYRSDTEAYLVNLADSVPSVYVVLRPHEHGDADEHPYIVWDATASPYEAQDYLDPGEDIIEAVPMPPALVAWVNEFVTRHHVEVPFVKRKRRSAKGEQEKFGKEPIFARRGTGRGDDEF